MEILRNILAINSNLIMIIMIVQLNVNMLIMIIQKYIVGNKETGKRRIDGG